MRGVGETMRQSVAEWEPWGGPSADEARAEDGAKAREMHKGEQKRLSDGDSMPAAAIAQGLLSAVMGWHAAVANEMEIRLLW